MKIKFILLVILLVTGCIDPVNFIFKDQVEHLEVESEFTDHPALQYIRLSRSSAFSYPYNQFEEFANVYITSNSNEYIPYYYTGHGYYYPDSTAAGVIGHIYTLHILTSNGNTYQSEPVTLNASVPIDTIYFQYAEELVALKGKREKELAKGYFALVKFKDPPEIGNYYRWSYRCQYEVKTYPENFIDYTCCRGGPVARPKPCCSKCWVTDSAQNFTVSDDRLTNGQEVVGQQVLFIPFQKFLNFKYKLTLYQHVIPEKEYLFYKNLNIQSQSNGGILDPPPSEIKGNIFNVESPDERVIGMFDASGVSTYQATLIGGEIPYSKLPFEYDDDCRTLENSTAVKPGNW